MAGNPNWIKGRSANPKGRAKGTKNKTKSLLSEQERRDIAARVGITPLEFLLSVLRDETAPIEHKLAAAKIAAPYMHMKMPVSVVTTFKTDEVVMQVREAVDKLFATTEQPESGQSQ